MTNNDEIKKVIEELKELVMQHVRTASNLDMYINQLESQMDKDPVHNSMVVNYMYRYRSEMIHNNFGNLDDQEHQCWQKLSELIKES